LPGGEWLLFTLARSVGPNRWNEAEIVIESLGDGERRVLRQGGSDARYLASGHVAYLFENDLYASSFDARALDIGDDRFRLVQGVAGATLPVELPPEVNGFLGIGAGGSGAGQYAVSRTGSLVYLPGRAPRIETQVVPDSPLTGAGARRSLLWVDRAGNATPLPIAADAFLMARISPDGKQVALVVGAVPLAAPPPPADIFVLDLETMNTRQITFSAARDDSPVWSADSRLIYYRSYVDDGANGGVYVISADGGESTLVLSSPDVPNPGPWSMADEHTLLLGQAATLTDVDLFALDVDRAEITPVLDDDAILVEPSVSPAGPWMLYYERPADGPPAINLRPYPNVRDQRRPVALGTQPAFAGDGTEIFYFDDEGLSAVPVGYEPFQVGDSTALFRDDQTKYWWAVGGPNGRFGRSWDVDPVNDRFLMISMPELAGATQRSASRSTLAETAADGEDRPPLHIVLNWFEELRNRVQP
jgi:hypothetical protein